MECTTSILVVGMIEYKSHVLYLYTPSTFHLQSNQEREDDSLSFLIIPWGMNTMENIKQCVDKKERTHGTGHSSIPSILPFPHSNHSFILFYTVIGKRSVLSSNHSPFHSFPFIFILMSSCIQWIIHSQGSKLFTHSHFTVTNDMDRSICNPFMYGQACLSSTLPGNSQIDIDIRNRH